MAMGPVKGQAARLQVEMVCVDELVAADDRLRRLDELVDWGFVRAEAAPYYAAEVGRPSVDPIVLVKLMLVGALEGIDSMRELLRVASMRVDVRRFLGYGFSERLPVHQTISHAQTRRFVDAKLFERLFLRSVALCREHGLIDGTHLSVDGFHVEANAALSSLRASLGRSRTAVTATARPRRAMASTRVWRRRGRNWRWSSRGRARRPSGAAATRPRARAAIPTPSCATSPGSARIWSTAHRSPLTPGRAAWWRVWARRPTGTRATRWRRSSSARALRARSLRASAPIRGSRASRSGRMSPRWG